MKKSNRIGLVLTTHAPVLLLTLEQFGLWIMTCGVDWSKLPLAFTGAAVSTWMALFQKKQKPTDPPPVHHSFGEWIFRIATGTVVGMAGWEDVATRTSLSPALSTVLAGAVGWLLIALVILLVKAKTKLETLTKPE